MQFQSQPLLRARGIAGLWPGLSTPCSPPLSPSKWVAKSARGVCVRRLFERPKAIKEDTEGKVCFDFWAEDKRSKSQKGRPQETKGIERRKTCPRSSGWKTFPIAPSPFTRDVPKTPLLLHQDLWGEMLVLWRSAFSQTQFPACSLQPLKTQPATDPPFHQLQWERIHPTTDLRVITATAKCDGRGYVPKM